MIIIRNRIPKIKSDYVKNVDLMSIEEYNKWRSNIIHKDSWWWLRSAGCDSDDVAIVDNFDNINTFGYTIYNTYGGVVPSLYIESENLIIGNKYYIIINGKKIRCTAVDNNVLVTDNIICHHRFDSDSNDYETSEIKQWLDEWKTNIE